MAKRQATKRGKSEVNPAYVRTGIIAGLILILVWLFTIGPLGANAVARRAELSRLAALPPQKDAMTLGRLIVDGVEEYAAAHGGSLPASLTDIQPYMVASDFELAQRCVKYELSLKTLGDLVDKDVVATVQSRDGYVLSFRDRSSDSYLFATTPDGEKVWNPETKSFKLIKPMLPLDRAGNPIGNAPLVK